MPNQQEYQLHNRWNAEHQKYLYWIGAINTALIGFSIVETKEAILTWYLLPAGLAVLFWILGLRSCLLAITYQIEITRVSILIQQATDLNNKDVSPAKETELIEEYKDYYKMLDTNRRTQLLWMIIGGVLFLIWHVFRIGGNTLS